MNMKRSKRNLLTELLEDPNKGVNKTYGAVGTLSRLFRQMLKDLNISGYQFGLLMSKFLSDPRNHIPDNKKDQTSNRGNLNKEFQKGTMTWKVFCKAMRFLQIVRFKITLEAVRENGKTTTHVVNVNLELTEPENDEFDEDDNTPDDSLPHVPYLDYDPNKD